LTSNGFAGEQATIYINNFRYKDSGEGLSGELYIKGSEHLKYQEFSNYFGASAWVRGGEVIILPEQSKFTLLMKKGDFKEEIPVLVQPAERVSTCNDELEVDDNIKFKVVKDVYRNQKLYIKKGAVLLAEVDNISENGWCFDNAEIFLKNFRVRDINGKIVSIEGTQIINGFEILKNKGNRLAQLFNYCGVLFRGKEIDIIPSQDDFYITLWLK
jgi:hypothetical protein